MTVLRTEMENFKRNIDERIDQTGKNQNALYFDLEELTVNVTKRSDHFNEYINQRAKNNEAQGCHKFFFGN